MDIFTARGFGIAQGKLVRLVAETFGEQWAARQVIQAVFDHRQRIQHFLYAHHHS
ncbi:hypothetical protein D3C78_1878720 [compost metagenome]